MKHTSQILNLLLALALVVLTVKITLLDGDKKEGSAHLSEQSQEQIAIENIMTRTSVRDYTDQMVEDEKIDVMLKAAMAAPIAGNRQPWHFVVIKDRAVLDSIPLVAKAAGMAVKAKLAIAVCGDPSQGFPGLLSQYWVQDCSAATENMLLAINAMKLGAVWCGVYPDPNKVEPMSKLLKLPSNLVPLNVVVIGYPKAEQHIKNKWKPEKVLYR